MTAVITGLGTHLPSRVVSNHDLADRLDTSDEWIRTRTGISTRRWVSEGESTSDLAVAASRAAISAAGGPEVAGVIVATTTPDHWCPATAPDVASRLGLFGVAACDVMSVCSGFIYGLATATGWIDSGVIDSCVMVGAETYSTILDPEDRTTSVIFGDGAGAVVLRAGTADEPGAIGPVVLGSDGTGRDLITVPGGGSRDRSASGPGIFAPPYFQMAGNDVYRHAVTRLVEATTEAIARAGWSADSVDGVYLHQANARICDAVGQRLGMGPDVIATNIARVGNTAAASLPLLLADAVRSGRLRPGHRIVLAAFGGGLSWGAVTLTWPDITTLPAAAGTPATAGTATHNGRNHHV